MVLVSVLVLVVVFLVLVECGIPIFVTGPPGTGKTSLVQTIVNAAIESETIATWTKNNNNNNNISDQHGCFPSQELDGEQQETVAGEEPPIAHHYSQRQNGSSTTTEPSDIITNNMINHQNKMKKNMTDTSPTALRIKKK